MFDKLLFDRNAFDRSVSSEGITLTMLGSSQVGLRLTVLTPVKSNIQGNSLFASNFIMQQRFLETFSSVGALNDLPIILKRSTVIALSGQGSLKQNFVIRTPIAANLSGKGGITVDSQVLMQQYITGTLSGMSLLTPKINLITTISGIFQGSGNATAQVSLYLPIEPNIQGQGDFTLSRLGALNENVISLIGVNLLPGDTITIDTNLLQVLFGSVEDVSSITSDSVFFELNPGENEIKVDIDSDNKLDITAIWQNRWL